MGTRKLLKSSNSSAMIDEEVGDLGWLWVLRLYASQVAHPLNTNGISPPTHLGPILGKYQTNEKVNNKEGPVNFLGLINRELREYKSKRPKLGGAIANNLALLTRKFGLSAIERDILTFRVGYRIHSALEQTLDHFITDNWLEPILFRTLAAALNHPVEAIEDALRTGSNLCGSGLLTMSPTIESNFAKKLSVLPGLPSAMSQKSSSLDALLSFAVSRAQLPTLACGDFPHHQQEIRLIRQHISQAVAKKLKGVNILLHGEPGTGKTELTRALALELKLNAYEVTIGGHDYHEGGFVHRRFHAFTLLQKMLSRSPKGLVIFDEIEDVLPRPALFERPGYESKAWLNNLVENNPVPAIWISNHVWHLDPALMRRFDIVLEIRTPPRSKRLDLLKKAFDGLPIDHRWLDRKANQPGLTPAIVQRSMRVIQNAGIKSTHEIQSMFDQQIVERFNALGIFEASTYPEPEEYQLDLLNTSSDMVSISSSLVHIQRGRLLLYGPPGCGKTAFAHHLAKLADRPLMLKRASDLMSMWMGETEKNLCKMFREATQDEAILLLDEADSFLQDRHWAKHSWELTQVNELLTQMENFRGVFICATNFIEHLDAAAMRRFTFKVKFDYLCPVQTEALFTNTLKILGVEIPNELINHKILKRLRSMNNLTPGDFATISDQFMLMDKIPSVDNLLSQLTQACEIKNGGRKMQIGFVA